MENTAKRDVLLQEAGARDDDEVEINLIDLFYALLSSYKLIIVVTLICALLAGGYSFFLATPMYQATAKLYVVNSNSTMLNLSDLQIGNYLASDYTEIFKTWEVNELVRSNLGLSYTYEQLQKMVSVTNPSDTRILYITVTSPDALQAAAMANEYTTVVGEYVTKVMVSETPNVFSQALVPQKPVSPNKTRNILLGILIGILLSAGFVVVRFILDDKIKSDDDITKYIQIPTLAIVPVQSDSIMTDNENAVSRTKTKRHRKGVEQ